MVVFLASPTATIAGSGAKSRFEAIRNHHDEQARTKTALANYDACISEHFGMNDCTKAFATLRTAQKAYARAVSEKAVQCGQ